MALEAIRSVSIRHAVADAVRGALRAGDLKPGENLSEVALAAKFEVSRGPIRAALLVLVEEGLLVHSPNRGFYVINFTSEDHAHIDQIRVKLEALALEQARDRATPKDLRKLEKMKDELTRMFHDSELPARDATEIAFHGYIWDLSGNPWLVLSLKRLLAPYFTFSRKLGLSKVDSNPGLAEAQHQLYFDYIARRTDRPAEECVRFHLNISP